MIDPTREPPGGTEVVGPLAKQGAFSAAGHQSAPLYVLLHGGIAAFQCPGGGEVQLLKTAEYLRRQGVRAKLFNPWKDRLAEADCLHLFGTLREHLPLAHAAKEAGTPVVLSTIAWYDLRGCWRLAGGWLQGLHRSARFLLRAAAPKLPSWRRQLHERVDLLLPNSRAEMQQLERYFGVPREKIHIVPNGADLPDVAPARVTPRQPPRKQGLVQNAQRGGGVGRAGMRVVDENAFGSSCSWDTGTRWSERIADSGRGSSGSLFPDLYGVSDYVLCPGRIEPRKNQLALVRAMRGLDFPVVILGEPVAAHRDYAIACRRAAGANVHFIPPLPRNSQLLASAYRCSACLVLPGWFETPGLAALEAALAQVPIVVTRIGAAREYFGDEVRYVHPSRPAEIRAAVQQAVAERARFAERLRNLARRVEEQFGWSRVAQLSKEAYEKVLS